MLLQSHEGMIRVFPSTPRDWPAAFTLCARGAFIVSSERARNAPPGFVALKSLAGNPCRIVNPWPEHGIVLRDPISGAGVPFKLAGDAITFDTALNQIYLLTPVESGNAIPNLAKFESQPNPGPKHLDEAILGKPRDF
jgi:alpha-L-fucosidase 2